MLKSGFANNEIYAHARMVIVGSLSQKTHSKIKSITGGARGLNERIDLIGSRVDDAPGSY